MARQHDPAKPSPKNPKVRIDPDRLRQARKAKNWHQADLAFHAGQRQATISGLEQEDAPGILLENAWAIADVLGVSLGWLCGRAK